MVRRRMRSCLLMLLALLLLIGGAQAETVRGDLSKRMGEMIETYEYNGITYQLRSRTSAVLAMAIDEDAQGVKLVRFARLLLVDDENKLFAMLDIPENTLVQVAVEGEESLWNMRLSDVYQLEGTPEENCQLLLEAVNRLLGQDMLESYIAFDLEGGAVLNGGAALTGNTYEKLSELKAVADTKTTDELNSLYGELGDFIVTNMKSGAVMKIIDKSSRYDRQETQPWPGEEVAAGNDILIYVTDAQALEEIRMDFFYEVSAW